VALSDLYLRLRKFIIYKYSYIAQMPLMHNKTLAKGIIIIIALATISFAQPAAPLQYGGKTYKTVKIGTQTWMAENLNYEAGGSKCYDNKPDNCTKYGRLYNWETALKVCPKGWHLPSNAEWDKLYRFVDGNTGSVSQFGFYHSSSAGKQLKAASGWNWNDDEGTSGNGTDEYGFSALPGGRGNLDGSFSTVGINCNLWSTSEQERLKGYAYYRIMDFDTEYAYWSYYGKSYLFSVRCLKD
jgi:uncharacterized protein (TIGR02145 family)